MSSLLRDFDVRQLVEGGYATYRFDQGLIGRAQEECRRVIERFCHRPAVEREFTRLGEDEPDLGFIRRDGKGRGDDKYFFHYANDLRRSDAPNLRAYELPAIAELYEANSGFAVEVGRYLCDAYPDLFPRRIITDLLCAGAVATPYSTNVLRGLYYPKKTDKEKRQGAKKHIDRGFLTQHFGDIGGDLLAYNDHHDEVGVRVSPPDGLVLVFFGVKVKYITGGAVEPLWHGSITEPGKDRQAMVQFNHINTGFEVRDANVAYRELVQIA